MKLHGSGLPMGSTRRAYYGVPFEQVERIAAPTPAPKGSSPSPEFAALCRSLAGLAPVAAGIRVPGGVAANGTVIEQEQILTTHNLAPLFAELDLTTHLGADLAAMAERCFERIVCRLQVEAADRQVLLRAIKNGAHGWRQMVFYLSLLPHGRVREFLSWAEGHLARQRSGPFVARFRPALAGLALAVERRPISGEARRFLGWSVGGHWLLPDHATTR